MAIPSKKPFKVNLLGLIRLETETDKPIGFNQILILCLIGIAFVIGLVLLLKAYAIPISAAGVIKQAGSSISKVIGSSKPGAP